MDTKEPVEIKKCESGKDRSISIDLDAMDFIQSRLSLGDLGRISVQIARAAAAKRPSELQRLLLALVEHKEESP